MALVVAAFADRLIIVPVLKTAAMTNTAPPATVIVIRIPDAPMTCLVPQYATANVKTSLLQFVKAPIPLSPV
jgi:D-arabinose 5-phosphate isomerase GutQ